VDAIISSSLFAAACLLLTSAATRFDKRITLLSAVITSAFLGLDDFVTGLPNLLPALKLIGEDWNWTGKFLSLALAAVAIRSLKISRDALGLKFRQEHPALGWTSLAAFVAWGASLGLLFKPGAAGAETLAFQATMPGLSEELVYRGVAPAILLGLIGIKPPVSGIPWVVVIATSLMFGVWHALSFSKGSVTFDLMSGLFPMIGSLAGGWLRFKTKSLIVPILGHSLANVAFHIAGGLSI